MSKEGLKQFNNEEEVKIEEPKEEPRHTKLSLVKEEEKKEQEKKTEPISEKFSSLEEKRNIYIEGYQQFLRETPKWRSAVRKIFGKEYREEELPEELKRLKSKYDEAKYAYCKDLIGSKKADLEKEGKSGEALETELAAYKFTELYSKYS